MSDYISSPNTANSSMRVHCNDDEIKLTPNPIHTATDAAMQSRKSRGRPPGSKNRPKPPVIITKESNSSMQPVMLEVSADSDVVAAVTGFARSRRLGLSVLNASGAVTNVMLRHTSVPPGTISLGGPFDILSLNGTIFPPSASRLLPPLSVSICLPHGQVFGGIVGGPLMAVGTVIVFAATFVSSEWYHLPLPPDEEEETKDVGDEGEEKAKQIATRAPAPHLHRQTQD